MSVAWVTVRRISFGVVVSMVGASYTVLEDMTDVWPAVLVFIVGGYAAGRLCPGVWALVGGPLAGVVAVGVGYATGDVSQGPFNLTPFAHVLIGLITGLVAVPTALIGTRVARSRHAPADAT